MEVLGVDPNAPATVVELRFGGSTAVGAGGVPAVDHPFDVSDGALYVDVRVTWTPQTQDAYDIEVRDPDGAVAASSGNGLEQGEAVLFAPRQSGRYVLRLLPFAAAGAQYAASVKVASPASP
jgi:hypothetical protein